MSVQGIGYPDWQTEAHWASAPLVYLLGVARTADYDSGTLYVGAWERLQFRFQPLTPGLLWFVAVTWWADAGRTQFIDSIEYHTATGADIIDAPPNAGPYCHIQIGCSSWLGAPVFSLIVSARNFGPRIISPPNGWVLAHLDSTIIVAHSVETQNLAQVSPCRAVFFAAAAGTTWLAAIQYYDLGGTLHTLVELTGDGVKSSDTTTVFLPENSCIMVLNNTAAANQAMLGAVTMEPE